MRLRGIVCILVLLCACGLQAQQTSASIQGRVVDSQGAVVVGAKVTLTDQRQGSSREENTNTSGEFSFTPLLPSTYTVTVEAAGFSKLEQKDIRLFAADRMQLPDIALAVGSVTETVNVEASAVMLQTLSSERSGVVTGTQLVEVAVNGRSYSSLFKTVVGFNGDSSNSNGRRSDTNNLIMDGVTTLDSGNNGMNLLNLNTDAIAEFKVLTNSQQAEYGRTSGGSVNIVTKSGGQQFHGNGYLFHRHEDLNANSFTNNFNGLPRARYRFNTPGFTFGGPVILPKVHYFRNKLFFFVAMDMTRQLVLGSEKDITVPTPLERTGDFSQTHLSNGARPTITDPAAGGSPFPGNVIPTSRINPDGAKILNFYPLPNIATNPAYNEYNQFPNQDNPRQHIIRGDYNITDRWRLYLRAIIDPRPITSVYGDQNSGNTLGIGKGFSVPQNGSSHMMNLTTIIQPTLTNEFIAGRAWNEIGATPLDDTYFNSRVGLSFSWLYPNADKLHMVPNFSWGGVSDAPSTSFRGLPYYNQDPTHDITDNVAKLWGAHTLKAGIYHSATMKQQVASVPVNGNLAFDQDSLNPGDTNYAFSNALLGNYRSFQQASVWPDLFYNHTNIEWYVQDNWKISRSFTLDYGLRMAKVLPDYEENNGISSFNPALYDPKQAVTLYQPTLVNGQKMALNPLTGQVAPYVLLGAVVPGSGNLTDGIMQAGQNGYPRGLMQTRGIQWGPRLGFAWNPGNGNTVIRAGAGVFYDRVEGNIVFSMSSNPPMILTPTVYYGNLTTLGAAGTNYFPSSVGGLGEDGKVPATYNWNFTVQRKLPFGTSLDAAYVGSESSHLPYSVNYNDPGFGSAWLPQNQDPTLGTPKYNGDTTLPVNLYRPFIGFGSAYMTAWGASSNYHALQVSVNHHMANGLEYSVAYTYSKALEMADGYNYGISYLQSRSGFYGLASFDRTQNLVVSYIYNLPKFARPGFANNALGRIVLNGWEFSGITTLVSGAPTAPSYSYSGVASATLNREITGSETIGPRPILTGPINMSPGDRNLYAWFNTSVVQPALKGSYGEDSAVRPLRGPGTNDFDLSLFKNIPFWHGEGRYVQLRCESYNAFNHTQGSGLNTSATFNAAGVLTNLPTALGGGGGRFGFGSINGFRSARIIQLAVKLYF